MVRVIVFCVSVVLCVFMCVCMWMCVCGGEVLRVNVFGAMCAGVSGRVCVCCMFVWVCVFVFVGVFFVWFCFLCVFLRVSVCGCLIVCLCW